MEPNNIKINIRTNRWAVLRKKWEKYLTINKTATKKNKKTT